MNKPSLKEIFNEELGEPVYSFSDTSYRHGERRTEVYKRQDDLTYWEIRYNVSTDGEENGLRDGYATIEKVEPYYETVIRFRSVECY